MSDRSALIQQLSSLTAPELGQLVTDLEETLGVKAVRAGPAITGPAPTAAPVEKTEFNVEIVSFPADKKVHLIKTVREITKLGLVEAKALVERAPVVVLEGVPKADAEAAQTQLETGGAVIALK